MTIDDLVNCISSLHVGTVWAAKQGTGLKEVLEAMTPPLVSADLRLNLLHRLENWPNDLGRGFCFEARQKRITFDNEHYFIDLVFYHRILKCHVLIDLKVGAFKPGDAGQMNLYLNYFAENEHT